MSAYDTLRSQLKMAPRKWLITGVAGFIGSNLLEQLLKLDQAVTGLDNFSTGKRENLEEIRSLVTPKQWERFRFIEGDITNLDECVSVCKGVEIVLHQAALGSVPRSIAEPIRSHESNVSGFLNMLVAARDESVKRFVYASSSSVYGDHPGLPKVELNIGKPLSPYAATKAMDEIYAEVFAKTYGMETIGLRYFNVFGPRQDPAGPYAAVIPLWIKALLNAEPIFVNGDGETSRDFCFVDNAVQANLLAATSSSANAINEVYNVAIGERTTLNQLLEIIHQQLGELGVAITPQTPRQREFRSGDVRHSLADIRKAQRLLYYSPVCRVRDGLKTTLEWHLKQTAGSKRLEAAVL